MSDNNTVVLEFKKPSQLKEIWRRLKKDKLAIFGLTVIVLMILLAIGADLAADYDSVIKVNVKNRLQWPSAEHWFGTDSYGRDLFARCLHGARISLSIGFAAAAVATVGGSLIGAMTGYIGGRFDTVVMRIIDIISAIPPTLLALAVVAALGPGAIKLLLALSFTTTPALCALSDQQCWVSPNRNTSRPAVPAVPPRGVS